MAKAKPKKKAVATAQSTAVDTINVGSFLEENQGDGSQNISTNDLEIPRLKLFHGNAEDAPEDVRKADIYNSITKQVWSKDEGVRVIPCAYVKQFTHWKGIEAGGGFLGSHDASSDILTKTKKVESKDMLVEGGELTDEYIRTDGNFFVLYEESKNVWKPAQLSLYSTNFKKAKLWNTMIKSQVLQGKKGPFNPPMYAFIYTIKGVLKKKDAMAWGLWEITIDQQVDTAQTLQDAKMLSQSVMTGDVVVKAEAEEARETTATDDTDMI
jgi:hypothetical protein